MATKTKKTTGTKRRPSTTSKSTAVGKTSIAKGISAFNMKNLLLPALIVLGIILLGVFKNQFIVANVNGDQITRLELLSELERSSGPTILQNLITQKLIEQEGESRGISVTDAEIDEEIANIEQSIADQGQSLDDLLAIQNFTRAQLREQIVNQVLLQKMVGDENIAVSEEELNQYIEENRDSFAEDANLEELKPDLRVQLEQQKLNTEVQNLLTQLQTGADIEILLN